MVKVYEAEDIPVLLLEHVHADNDVRIELAAHRNTRLLGDQFIVHGLDDNVAVCKLEYTSDSVEREDETPAEKNTDIWCDAGVLPRQNKQRRHQHKPGEELPGLQETDVGEAAELLFLSGMEHDMLEMSGGSSDQNGSDSEEDGKTVKPLEQLVVPVPAPVAGGSSSGSGCAPPSPETILAMFDDERDLDQVVRAFSASK